MVKPTKSIAQTFCTNCKPSEPRRNPSFEGTRRGSGSTWEPKMPESTLFDKESDLNHSTLERLGELLRDLRFKVHKKRRSEGTLRVYLKKQDYPLLNPRLVQDSPSQGHVEVNIINSCPAGRCAPLV